MTSDLPLLAWGRLSLPSARRAVLGVAAMPTPRPRVTRTGIAFMPKPYQLYAAGLQRELHQIAAAAAWEPLQGPLAVRVVVTKAEPRKTVLAAPRGDVDNLAKGVLDAATKTQRWWLDDVQITHLFVAKAWGSEDQIELIVNTLEDTP